MTIDTWVNIGAIIIGLVGLFYSVWYNGRLAREQQERQWKHEITKAEEKDRRERVALQSALRIELQDIHGSIQTHIKYAKEAQNAGFLLVGRATLSTEVYQAALPRIGILPKNQIRILTQAYKGLETQSEKVKLLGQDYEAGQVKIPAKHCDTFILMMRAALSGRRPSICCGWMKRLSPSRRVPHLSPVPMNWTLSFLTG